LDVQQQSFWRQKIHLQHNGNSKIDFEMKKNLTFFQRYSMLFLLSIGKYFESLSDAQIDVKQIGFHSKKKKRFIITSIHKDTK
jgi:hypothetical protein